VDNFKLMLEVMGKKAWKFFQENWANRIAFVLGVALFPPIMLITTSLLGWTGASIFAFFLTLMLFGFFTVAGQIIGAGVGKAVDLVDRDKVNDSSRAAHWAKSVGETGIKYTLLWAALTFVWKPGSDPGAFIMAFTIWVAAHVFLSKKIKDEGPEAAKGAQFWKDKLEALFITLLLSTLGVLLYRWGMPRLWRTTIGRNIVALTRDIDIALDRDFRILGSIFADKILGPIMLPVMIFFLLGLAGFVAMHTVKKSTETVAGISRTIINKGLLVVLAVSMSLIALFFLMSALSAGGGQVSLASTAVGFPKFGTGYILPALVVITILFVLGFGLLKSISSAKANPFLGILGLLLTCILITAYVGGCAQGTMGMHPSQRMRSEVSSTKLPSSSPLAEAVTSLPDTTGWYRVEFEILPHRITPNQKLFGFKIQRGDVLPYLFEDGTQILIVHNDGHISSNLGKALADRTLEGYPYKHPCKADSMLPYPNQLEALDCFVATRYACDTCQVQRPVLSFEKPGGPPCKGGEIKTGKIFTVLGESVAVVRVNSWYEGQQVGNYRVEILCSRKPRPYTVVASTVLLPKPGRCLPHRPLFVPAFLCYTANTDNLVAADSIEFASTAHRGVSNETTHPSHERERLGLWRARFFRDCATSARRIWHKLDVFGHDVRWRRRQCAERLHR